MSEKRWYSIEVKKLGKHEIQYIGAVEFKQISESGSLAVQSIALVDRFIDGWVNLTLQETIILRRYLRESGLFQKLYEAHDPIIGTVELFGAFTQYDQPERGVTMIISGWDTPADGGNKD